MMSKSERGHTSKGASKRQEAARKPGESKETPRGGGGGGTHSAPVHRGFAAMDPDKQREIARKGGRAAHEQGVAHEFTSEEARAAGRKGGEAVSQNRDHMSVIGKKGGEARGKER
jgi:general stress protein YciG